jgi:hypothetical protein
MDGKPRTGAGTRVPFVRFLLETGADTLVFPLLRSLPKLLLAIFFPGKGVTSSSHFLCLFPRLLPFFFPQPSFLRFPPPSWRHVDAPWLEFPQRLHTCLP